MSKLYNVDANSKFNEVYLNEFIQSIQGMARIEERGTDFLRVVTLKDNLYNVIEKLLKIKDVYLRTMVSSDERAINGFFKLYYVFGIDTLSKSVIIEVPLTENDLIVPTLVNLVKAVDWYEREAHDLMGIKFAKRNLYRFVLPDDWPTDVYPLRKDYTVQDLMKLYTPKVIEHAKEVEAETVTIIPIGPYHPALHEPEYFELYVRGEKIVDVRYIGFMVHRGIEKLGESMKYNQVPFLAERICGICGFVHSTSYCQAVEHALRIDVPERAQYIRSIVLELERLHSHLLWLGVAFHLLGYDTGFMHSWRIREQVMILAELLTGSRKTYGINIVGGVRRDIDEDKIRKFLEVLKNVEKEFKTFIDIAISVPQVKARLKGTGILPKSEAQALSLVGPTVRGSGIPRDVRKDYPYAAYRYVHFDVAVQDECDNMARALVRVNEIFESIDILRQLLDKLPKGAIAVESWEPEPHRIGIGSVEAPRGEVIHMVITGTYSPYRWRVRAPTYQNLPAVPIMLREMELADAPITIASIDPCFSCTDRALIINIRKGKIETVPLYVLSRKKLEAVR
ncbi:MAG: NADH-quinone oxidoreductase subunit C [Ignisphaera sp.]